MTIKRLLLIGLTLIVLIPSVSSLFGSWQEPQFQSRLELYQTNIILQAQAWQAEPDSSENFQAIQQQILGEKPLESATNQYQQAQKSVTKNLDSIKKQLVKLPPPISTPVEPLPKTPRIVTRPVQQKQLQQSIKQQQKLLAELDLRLGILQAQQGKIENADQTWTQLQQNPEFTPEFTETAKILTGLWSNPPQILPNAQQLIQQNLDGWFRSTALIQLYQLQQRQDALATIQAAQQEAATNAILKLITIATIPYLSALIGVILMIFLGGQLLIKGKTALLAQNAEQPWSTPWGGEIILQVFVFGFLLMGQFLVPVVIELLPISRPITDIRLQAIMVFISYMMVALGSLSVLYFSIKRFFPLPEFWFHFRLQFKAILWGLGGYCTALPIVVVVSLINQQLWQGQGGSNPLLQLALESRDSLALGIFFFTAAIAAPIFEEFLFRGFLLPSLTRYLPVWGTILVSSLLFAAAHLSLSEILPLTALGIVLGVVYTRSRNLLAPMLLHSLWNSGTLLSLFILGSGNN
jgi:membrane protease YdiL (CAAX protease family)